VNPDQDLRFKDVLVVEDEIQLSKTLAVALKHLGLQSRFSTTLQGARAEIKKQIPDLVLLDRMLPDGDGLSLCREIRLSTRGAKPMVLILSARGETLDRVEGLEDGADDYLPKPFSIDELHARIRALSRRFVPSTEPPSPLPKPDANAVLWTMDVDMQKVLGPKGWVSVTQLEFKLLEKFVSQPGKVLSRDDLLKDVWGFQWLPKTRTVDFFMSRVRKNFEKDPDKPRHFMTVRGIGYRFEP
jgi:two-component system, OmpR family, alkaline phosphatase synthesis response regulator PhoP